MKFFHKAMQEKLFAINYEMEKNLFIRPFVVSEEWQTFINFEIGSFDFNGEYAHRNYVFNDVW